MDATPGTVVARTPKWVDIRIASALLPCLNVLARLICTDYGFCSHFENGWLKRNHPTLAGLEKLVRFSPYAGPMYHRYKGNKKAYTVMLPPHQLHGVYGGCNLKAANETP